MLNNRSARAPFLTAAAFSSSMLALSFHPAIAQDSAPALPSIQEDGTVYSGHAVDHEDNAIVVTAQRRVERSRDVPVSITAIGADQIRQAGLQQLTDIAEVTPGLRFDYVGTFVQPTIRGIGTSFATSGGLGNVAIYVDGFYSPNPLGADFQLANVESIQVLKGPQGTLFGRNTTGGAILVTTKQPSMEPSAVFEASYGSFNSLKYQGYATAGVGDKVAFDIEGMYKRGDGFATDIGTDNDEVGRYRIWGVRTGVKVAVSEDVSLLMRFAHNDANDPTANIANAYVLNGVPLTTGASPAIVATRPNQVALDVTPSFRTKSNTAQMTITADLGAATLTSYTQYRKDDNYSVSDLDYTTAPVFGLYHPTKNKTFTQEFLLNSAPGGRLQWTAGAFYVSFVDHYDVVQGAMFGAPKVPTAASSTTTESIAAFADATYEIADNLFLTAGLRYSHDVVRDAWLAPPVAGVLTRVDVPSLKSDRVTPRVVIRYKPSNESSVYASYTKGYKPGMINVGGGVFDDSIYIKPEKISAWEVGFKYEERGFSFDTAAFYYDYSDLQVSSYIGTASLITNAASARIYGVEAQGRFTPFEGFDFNVAAGYTDAKYENFDTAPFYDLSQTDLYLIGTRPGGASGQQMLRAPKFTGSVGARYAMDLGGGRLALSGNLYHTSSFAFDASGQFRQPGYETLGLRAEWTDSSERYTIAVFGDNVTGERYRTQVLPSIFAVGNVWSSPATVGASFRVKM